MCVFPTTHFTKEESHFVYDMLWSRLFRILAVAIVSHFDLKKQYSALFSNEYNDAVFLSFVCANDLNLSLVYSTRVMVVE
jgi:hypothetical protein